ncbi:MAG: DUF484 family protein [Pseudomonadota bacterium]|jgi:uncharacterized protein YigA (DUF484 family)
MIKAEDIAQYLQDHPEFFEAYAPMLAEITIPHPYGGRTISLSERQLLALREKNRALEKTVHEVHALIEYARENQALQEKVHRYVLTLFAARDLDAVKRTSVQSLREIFEIPHAEIRVWKDTPPSVELLAFADQQTAPSCTHHAVHEVQEWFGEFAPHLRSFAYLPLRAGEQSSGLLVMASEDPQRFYPEMGTMFLQRIADVVSAAVQPNL